MSESEKSYHELNEFADSLRSLVPLPSSVSRDELMFRAGQASVQQVRTSQSSRRWLWPMSTAACALLAAMIGMKVGQGTAERNNPIVHSGASAANSSGVDVVSSPTTTDRHPGTAYLAERNRILARGVDAVPAANSNQDAPSADPSYFELRDGLLHRDRS